MTSKCSCPFIFSQGMQGEVPYQTNNANKLDCIRTAKGNPALRIFFNEMINTDINAALNLINEEDLCFSSLFALKSEAALMIHFEELSLRNKIALQITNEILLTGHNELSLFDCRPSHYIEAFHSVLRWILITGAVDVADDDEINRVFDAAASLLIKVYSDRTMLTIIVEVIFSRHRKGAFYNDLVWILFESQCHNSLVLIANRLKSDRPEDAELADRLLSFIPHNGNASSRERYQTCMSWIEENNPYLYYTGEGFQQAIDPKPYRVVLEAKYLCKRTYIDTGHIIEPLSEEEYGQLGIFSTLDAETKAILSDYSHTLHNRNIDLWHIWRHYPITVQAEMAQGRVDKSYD